jgi:DNA-binding transcriptional MerR regulator
LDEAMNIQKPLKKLYYSLRQAAEMSGMTTSVIKRWEEEFPLLKPARNRAGNRHYTEKDLTLIFLIKELLLEQKLSVDEAREYLKNHNAQIYENEALGLKRALAEVRLEIQEIMDLIGE